MSQSNADVIRDVYAAFAAGNPTVLLGLLDPQVKWVEADNFLYADRNPYIGPQAIVEGVLMRLGANWEGFSATPNEFIDGGDAVVVLGRYGGKSKATGTGVDAQFVHVYRFRDGKIVSFNQYTDTAQWRDAAGAAKPALA